MGFKGMLQGDEEMMQRELETMQSLLERSPRSMIGLRVRLLSGRCCHKVIHCRPRAHDKGVVLRICCPIDVGAFRAGSMRMGSEWNSPYVLGKSQSSARVQWTKGEETDGQGRNTKHGKTPPKDKWVNFLPAPSTTAPSVTFQNFWGRSMIPHLLDVVHKLNATDWLDANILILAGTVCPISSPNSRSWNFCWSEKRLIRSKVLRHAMRTIFSIQPKCSHSRVSLKEPLLKPVLILNQATRISTEQKSMRAKSFKHIAS